MRRGGGVIPPGRAGLIVLAVAMVPIVVKKFKPIVRWTGKKLTEAGQRVTKMADEVERFDREKEEREEAVRKRGQERSAASKKEKGSTMSKDAPQQDENAATPKRSTASPHSQPEMEAQKTKPKAASGSGGAAKRFQSNPGPGPPLPLITRRRDESLVEHRTPTAKSRTPKPVYSLRSWPGGGLGLPRRKVRTS